VGTLAVKNSTVLRRYYIKKDFFSGLKLGQFSIFDSTQKNLLYRLKSYYKIGGKLELIDQSSKKVIGNLTNARGGDFSLFDSSSNQWINGKIERLFNILDCKAIIKWNKRSILMATKFASLTTTFEYEYHSGLLAKVKKRSISFISTNRYDLQILSNDLPDTFYFFGLAIADQQKSFKGKG
jgi:hypothetical protein